MGLIPAETLIGATMHKAHHVFAALSTELGKQLFFIGGSVSLADVQIACAMDMFAMTPEWGHLTANTSNLVAWLARLNVRPSFPATPWERITRFAEAL